MDSGSESPLKTGLQFWLPWAVGSGREERAGGCLDGVLGESEGGGMGVGTCLGDAVCHLNQRERVYLLPPSPESSVSPFFFLLLEFERHIMNLGRRQSHRYMKCPRIS